MAAGIGAASLVAFVAATDLPRSREFYEEVLGLAFVAEDTFALVFDLAGTPLRVARVESFQPQPFTVLGWDVGDVVAKVHELVARGVVFERFPSLEQDPDGIWTSPSGARIAWFKDPDGNLLSVGSG